MFSHSYLNFSISANILPKPVCRSLLYIFDWKAFVIPNLADPQLTNHTRYNSFVIAKEDGRVKLRAKKLPQHPDSTLYPRAGIQLLKDNTQFGPVGAASFRVEEIQFDQIFSGIHKFVSKLHMEEKMRIVTSWGNLRQTLESLPGKIANLRKMKLTEIPKQVLIGADEDTDEADEYDEGNQMTGNLCPESIVEGNLEDDIEVGTDVCVYTETIQGRPWVGRVQELMPDKKFRINWFSRRTGRGKIFRSLKSPDGSASVSELDYDSIIFWDMSEQRTKESFSLANFWLESMRLEYEKLDKQYE